MKTMKIGAFPGEIKEYVVEEGIRVIDALAMAGIKPTSEQAIKLDDEQVELTDEIYDGNLLIVTKRMKGAI